MRPDQQLQLTSIGQRFPFAPSGDNLIEVIVELLIGVTLSGIVFGGGCAIIATNKNRDAVSWFVLGFFFSLVALIVIAAIPPVAKYAKSHDDADTSRDRSRREPLAREALQKKANDLAAALAHSKSKLDV